MTPLPDAAWRISRDVARHLGLGDIQDLVLAPGGRLNQNLVATTPRGRYFLKGSRYPDLETIRKEHQVIAFVATHNIPVVKPIADRAGETATRAGNRWWVTYPWIEGTQLDTHGVSPTTARIIGLTLGAVHRVLAQMPGPVSTSLPRRPLLNATEARMSEVERAISRTPNPSAFDQHVLASIAYRRTLMARDRSSHEGFASLPTQVLHGDFHLGNLLINRASRTGQASISAIVDWELTCWGPRIWEVARSADLIIDLATDLERGWPCLREYLSAYLQEAPLTPSEATQLAPFYRASRVQSLWVIEEHYRRGHAPTDEIAIDDLAALDWWYRNGEAVGTFASELMRSTKSIRPILT